MYAQLQFSRGYPTGQYLPRGFQRPFLYAFHMELYRTYILVWHRRYGKDRTVLNACWPKLMQYGWPVWHGFPEFAQGRDVFWNAVDPHTGRRVLEDVLPYTTRVNDQRMILWFGDIYYQVIGFDRFNRRVGAGPKILIFSEFSLMNPQARSYFRPMMAENKGIEVYPYTMRGSNHGAALADAAAAYPAEYFYSELNIDQTVRDAPGEKDYGQPVVPQSEVEHERRLFKASSGKAGMSEEMIEQEWYNSREGVNTGKVFGKHIAAARKEGRIKAVPHDPRYLVHTAWDRGVHNRVWFYQDPRGEPRGYIDYLATDNTDLPEIWRQMQEGHRARYHYGDHWVAIDADQFSPWHPKSGTQLAEDLNLHFRFVPKLSIQAGIEQARGQIAVSVFDAERCQDGLVDLGEYEYERDDKHGSFRKEPNRKQLSSHAADAFRYSAVADKADQQLHRPPPGQAPPMDTGGGWQH